MGKEDKLYPIITLTVYYGEKPWDGPKTLKDMVYDMPVEIERVFSDYSMNLIEVRDSGKYIFHNEEVRTAFEISKDIFEGNIDNTVKKYSHVWLRKEVWNFIGMITDVKAFLTKSYDEEDDNMCEALERWAAEKIKQVEQAQRAAEQAQQAAEQAQQAAEQVKQAVQQTARQASEEARAKGMEQGIEQGIEQGRRYIVKNMLNYGLSWEVIAEMTGLPKEEVRVMKEHAGEDYQS